MAADINGVVVGNEITSAGCWSHIRRKIIEGGESRCRDRAESHRDGALYAIEKQATELSATARLHLRQRQSAPVLVQLRQQLLPERRRC
jgi:Transposase IS66 family